MAVDKFSSAAGPNTGLIKVVPTSVTVGSGSSSVDVNGNITFSGASSITIDGVFSSTYQNYRYLIDAVGSANQACQFRFRNSGGDVTGGFYGGGHYVTYTGTSGLVSANNASAIDVGAFGTNGGNVSADIHNPFSTTGSTSIFGQNWYPVSAYTMAWGYAITPNNFTGFRINPASGTLSGTLRIYGYNQ